MSRRRTLPSAAPTGQDLRIRTRRPDRRARPTRRNGDPPPFPDVATPSVGRGRRGARRLHADRRMRRVLGVGQRRRLRRRGCRDPDPRRHRDLRTRGRERRRLVPARIPAGDLGHPGGQSHLRHPDRARRARRVPAVPGRVGHPQRRLHPVDHRPARRGDVPRRITSRRDGGQEQHRRLARRVPRTQPPAVHVRVRTDQRRRRCRRRHGEGHDEDVVAVVPGLPVQRRPLRDHRPGPARRPRELRPQADRNRSVPAGRVEAQRPPHRQAQRQLLATRPATSCPTWTRSPSVRSPTRRAG